MPPASSAGRRLPRLPGPSGSIGASSASTGISSGTVFSLSNEIWNGAIPVINIDGIAIGLLLRKRRKTEQKEKKEIKFSVSHGFIY